MPKKTAVQKRSLSNPAGAIEVLSRVSVCPLSGRVKKVLDTLTLLKFVIANAPDSGEGNDLQEALDAMSEQLDEAYMEAYWISRLPSVVGDIPCPEDDEIRAAARAGGFSDDDADEDEAEPFAAARQAVLTEWLRRTHTTGAKA